MRFISLLILALAASGCASNSGTTTSTSTASTSQSPAPAVKAPKEAKPAAKVQQTAPADAILINDVIPYAANSRVAPNIRRECQINRQLSQFIQSYSKDAGFPMTERSEVSPRSGKRVLIVEIVDAVSHGSAYVGHRKYTEIEGKYYVNGKLAGSFTGARYSGGGAFGGYKGSCSVLGRTVKVLGRDVSEFLRNPSVNARLGDRH